MVDAVPVFLAESSGDDYDVEQAEASEPEGSVEPEDMEYPGGYQANQIVDDDEEDEEEIQSKPRTRRAGPSNFVHLSDSDGYITQRVTRQPRARRTGHKSRHSLSEDDLAVLNQEISSRQPKKRKVDKAPGKYYISSSEDENEDIPLQSSSEEEEDFDMSIQIDYPSTWITETVPQRSPYRPQLGDDVWYIPQGHFEWAEKVKDIVDVNVDLSLPDTVRGVVVEIHYSPSPVVCTVKLDLGNDNQMPIRWFDLEGHADFIILDAIMGQCLEQDDLKVGDKCAIMYADQDSPSPGIITRVSETSSPWLKYTANLNDKSIDSVSPWELVDDDQAAQPLPILELSEAKRLADIIQHVMGLVALDVFIEQVSYDTFPSYLSIIGYPTFLSQIFARLNSGFYRSFEQVLWEWDTLVTNALKFNNSESDVSVLVKGTLQPFRDELLGKVTVKRSVSRLTARTAVPRFSVTEQEDDQDFDADDTSRPLSARAEVARIQHAVETGRASSARVEVPKRTDHVDETIRVSSARVEVSNRTKQLTQYLDCAFR